MNIGFVSTWFERGAAYVTKQYAEVLKRVGHSVFVYARGEQYAKNDPNWDTKEVTWGRKLYDTNIDVIHFGKWIVSNRIDCVFFNEQRDVKALIKIKLKFPSLKIGTYVDYYTQNTVSDFEIYDFIICNTKRHFSVFSNFFQCYYVPWGTNVDLFKYKETDDDCITFFHSAGLSNRKGTDVLIRTFIESRLYEQSKLVIHTQLPIKELINLEIDDFEKYNIRIINKTVTAPGLYHLGNVYVYPTTLDGLGLTLYEALSCGLPVITTDSAPMNEVINDSTGRLVHVDNYKCRWDAYYWPLSFVNQESLADAMNYYIENKEQIKLFRKSARNAAEKYWNWFDRSDVISDIFCNSDIKVHNKKDLKQLLKRYKKNEQKMLAKSILPFLPLFIQRIIFRKR